MSVKIIYFVHGTTKDNIKHKSTGWLPGELSKKGIKQSIELKEQINIDDIDLVICSDLERAIDSAEYTFKDLKKILQDKRIRECNYEEHINNKFPNGESLKDVEERLRDFCNYLLENYNGKTIALVAHKAPQLALDVITKNITWEQALEQDWRKTKNWKPGWIYQIGE